MALWLIPSLDVQPTPIVLVEIVEIVGIVCLIAPVQLRPSLPLLQTRLQTVVILVN